MAKKDTLIAVRLSAELVAEIDRAAELLETQEPGPSWSRSAAVRRLVIEGLKALQLPAPGSER